MGTNQDYKNKSLNVHRGNWAPALVATIVFLAVAVIGSVPGNLSANVIPQNVLLALSGGSLLFSLFILMPLEVGYYNALKVQLKDGDNAVNSNMFRLGFAEGYLHNVWSMFLMGFKAGLWALLLLIPGIVKGLAYAMTPYIIKENPEMKAIDAIHLSQDMMRGHKYDLFYLGLSFIGWIILGIFTLGIGLLWVIPYIGTAQAAFYEDLKAEYEAGKIAG